MHQKLSALLLLLAACGEAPPAGDTASDYRSGRPGSEDGYAAVVDGEHPFSGELGATVQRIQTLPSDRFFQENYYPGSSVVDVKRVFSIPTVKLASDAAFAEIDAFYRERFTGPDGEVQGRPGLYHRMTPENRMERVEIREVPGGRCEIVLQM
jgi:hypothetical protein